jgi:hypothetical protein
LAFEFRIHSPSVENDDGLGWTMEMRDASSSISYTHIPYDSHSSHNHHHYRFYMRRYYSQACIILSCCHYFQHTQRKNTMNRQQQRQQIVLSLPEPNQLVGLAVQTAGRFAKNNPIITGTYLFGWIFLLLVGNGTLLTVQQQREYNKIMVRRRKAAPCIVCVLCAKRTKIKG